MKLAVTNLNKILDEAEPLSGMGIVIKEISRDGDRAVYVAEIPAKAPGKGYVTPHFHPDLNGGTEWYQILEASDDAYMCTGKPILTDGKVTGIDWFEPASVKADDFFVIPNGVVHSLVAGSSRLRFTFGCPDAHLDDNLDKIVITGELPPVY